MARGRMVNKKISNDKRINDMPLQAELLFTWLIPHLDCNGCFYGSTQMIKSLVIPRKNWSKKLVEKCLTIMENSKNNEGTPLICRYTVNSEQYLIMPGFASEQTGLRYDKEKPEFPTFDGKNTEIIPEKSVVTEQEVEVETEQEVKEESVSLLDVYEVYKKEIMGSLDESASIPEDIEEELEATVKIFTAAWVIDAIREGVKRKRKDWRYITGILKNWKRYGKDADFPKGPHRIDPDKYIKGKYGHMVRR